MRAAVLLVVTGCFAKPSAPGPGAPDSSSGAFHKTIELKPGTSEMVANFPASIVIDDAELSARDIDAGHLGFTDEQGQSLPCEIVQLSAGSLEAWVSVPELAPMPSTTKLEMVYGPQPAAPCDPAAMWAGYAGAWHLSGTTNAPEHDSAGHYDLVTGEGFTLPDATPNGVIGGGRSFTRTSVGQQMCGVRPVPADSPVQFDQNASFGFEIWVNETMQLGSFDTALNKGGSSIQQIGFDLELGDTPWYVNASDGATGSPHGMNAASGTPTPGTWYLLSAVIDRGSGMMSTYANGLFVAQTTIAFGSLAGPNPVCIGWNTDPFDGVMDEARIFTATRTLDYFLAEYQNAMSRSDFVTVGPEQ